MKNEKVLSRREVVRGLVVLAAGSALVACKKNLTCTDTAGLAPEEEATRTALAYNDVGPDASKHCDVCQLYKPAGPDSCGSCTVVKGPINPKGTCKSWVQKQS